MRFAHARPPKGAPTPASCLTHDPRNPGRNRRKSGPLPGALRRSRLGTSKHRGASTVKFWVGNWKELPRLVALGAQRSAMGGFGRKSLRTKGSTSNAQARRQNGDSVVYARCTELLGFLGQSSERREFKGKCARVVACCFSRALSPGSATRRAQSCSSRSFAQNSDGPRHAFNIRSPSDFRGNCSSRRAAEFSLGPPGVRAGAKRTPRRAIETRSARGGMGSRGTQPSDVPT